MHQCFGAKAAPAMSGSFDPHLAPQSGYLSKEFLNRLEHSPISMVSIRDYQDIKHED